MKLRSRWGAADLEALRILIEKYGQDSVAERAQALEVGSEKVGKRPAGRPRSFPADAFSAWIAIEARRLIHKGPRRLGTQPICQQIIRDWGKVSPNADAKSCADRFKEAQRILKAHPDLLATLGQAAEEIAGEAKRRPRCKILPTTMLGQSDGPESWIIDASEYVTFHTVKIGALPVVVIVRGNELVENSAAK